MTAASGFVSAAVARIDSIAKQNLWIARQNNLRTSVSVAPRDLSSTGRDGDAEGGDEILGKNFLPSLASPFRLGRREGTIKALDGGAPPMRRVRVPGRNGESD